MGYFDNIFAKKLNKDEKLDFLEYLAFQLKTDMSFEKALTRYHSNENRKKHILLICENAINDIQNGQTPADALFDNNLIEELEYGIVRNSKSNKELYKSLESIININKGNIENKNALSKAVKGGVGMISFLFLLLPFFKSDIEKLYSSFEKMQEMIGNKDAIVEPPFLVEYWWVSFIIVGIIIGSYFFVSFLFKLIYKNYTKFYYSVFRNIFFQDLISVLKTFHQLQMNMSTSSAYQMMVDSSPNKYWEDFFQNIIDEIRSGEKATKVFIQEKDIIPMEITNAFIDAEETSEWNLYLEKATDFAIQKSEDINAQIKEWAPLAVNMAIFMVIGLLILMFIQDVLKNGLMDIMSGI